MTTTSKVNYIKYTARIPETVWPRLLRAAERDGMTVAEFVREAIKDRIKRRAKDHQAINAEYTND